MVNKYLLGIVFMLFLISAANYATNGEYNVEMFHIKPISDK